MKYHLEAYGVRKFNVEQAVWTRLGTAFRNSENNFVLKLDAMPAPVDGQFQIVVIPPKRPAKTKPEERK